MEPKSIILQATDFQQRIQIYLHIKFKKILIGNDGDYFHPNEKSRNRNFLTKLVLQILMTVQSDKAASPNKAKPNCDKMQLSIKLLFTDEGLCPKRPFKTICITYNLIFV